MGRDITRDAANLIRELRVEPGNEVRTVAVLWTWLEANMVALGSLRDKPSMIYEAALQAPAYDSLTEDLLTWLAERPLRNAAELLARISETLGPRRATVIVPAIGFGGAEVLVAWRNSALVTAINAAEDDNEADDPPTAVENPSLSALARNIVVCPRHLNGIELRNIDPLGEEWDASKRRLDRGLAGPEPTLQVHLDTLGTHGLSGGHVDKDRPLGSYRESRISDEDQDACIEAAELAIEHASGVPSVLVLPELGATEPVLEAVKAKLARTPKAPALTVVGMYHREIAERPDFGDLAVDAEIADYVNEAVVVGPGGSELWRHRKLSCAQGRVSDEPGAVEVTEDICLGTELGVIDTPLGWLSVIICLDSFAPHSRQRLASSPASVLLVPSLSPRVLRHRDSLQHLVQELWAAAFVCNRAPYGSERAIWSAEKTRSFWTASKEILVIPEAEAPGRPAFVFDLAVHQSRHRKTGSQGVSR